MYRPKNRFKSGAVSGRVWVQYKLMDRFKFSICSRAGMGSWLVPGLVCIKYHFLDGYEFSNSFWTFSYVFWTGIGSVSFLGPMWVQYQFLYQHGFSITSWTGIGLVSVLLMGRHQCLIYIGIENRLFLRIKEIIEFSLGSPVTAPN